MRTSVFSSHNQTVTPSKQKQSRKMVVVQTFGKNGHCSICKLSDNDVVNYGEIHSVKELSVHLFCLYFSTNLPQNGSDAAGIVGFQIYDIRKWITKISDVICCYCDKGSATTSCHFPNCRRTFHQVCGFAKNARFEYLGEFRTFCDQHTRIENEKSTYPESQIGCFLCYEGIDGYNPVTTVPSYCCGNWFHHTCLRKYALYAGYSFMCPTCRDKKYADSARRHGIYVPAYEALWEKTHDYADIERFYTHCDAAKCVCPKGREFTNTKWSLQLCSCCGSFGYHKLCRPPEERNNAIICANCTAVVNNWETNDPVNTRSFLVELQMGQEEDARNEVIDLTKDDSSDDNMNESLPPDDEVKNIPSENDVVDTKEQNVVADDAVNNIPSENDVVDMMEKNVMADDEVNNIPNENDVIDMQEQNVVDDEVNNIPSENDVIDMQEHNVVVYEEANNIPSENNAVDMQEHNVVVDGRRHQGLNENMAEKHAREKAERPMRDKMRYYLIIRWLRDYERLTKKPFVADPDEALDFE